MIRIVKASAGSGKTYTLAKTYIKLLLAKRDRYAYRHILAVTFTNKATDEMKNRIMKELFVLATNPEASPYADEFLSEFSMDIEALQKTADDILSNILHDYSAFSVSTIDRFFQQTLKAFSREIGQFASYKVELDKYTLVRESVDRILDSLTEENKDAVKWLTDSVMEQFENGRRYNLEVALTNMSWRLKSDEHRQQIEKFGINEDKAYSKENLIRIRAISARVISDFENKIKAMADRAIDIFSSAGLNVADFSYKFIKALYNYSDFKKGLILDVPSASFFTRALEPDLWFPKAKAAKFKPLVYPFLETALEDFCKLFEDEYKIYRTAHVLMGQLYSLGVAADLYREFNALLKEKNVLSIDDSNTILRDIIDGSDTPFVYEKLGVRFENFLLDEFQDTSRIQWENFYPLLKESNDNNNENLIVGDVKQSIYRWRGSDWNLMENEIQNAFDNVRIETLDKNFRSRRNIINFNNEFFKNLAAILDELFDGEQNKEIENIYGDVEQQYPKQKDEEGNEASGQVKLSFCEEDAEIPVLIASVQEAMNAGFKPSDIAILVRTNYDGSKVATSLMDAGIKVMTDESLSLKSSAAVRRLVSLLSYMDNPADMINGYFATTSDIELPEEYHSLIDLCESLIRELQEKGIEDFSKEIPYIQSFMDCVDEYTGIHGNGIHAFLKYWETANPSISSLPSDEAVIVMTIHKSKGLDFPFVILPFAESTTLSSVQYRWCMLNAENTPFSETERAIYDVWLTSDMQNTLFAEDFRKELKMQYIDNINTLYVAMTRAKDVLHIIAEHPSKAIKDYEPKGKWVKFSASSHALYMFALDRYAEAGMDLPQEDDVVSFEFGTLPVKNASPQLSVCPDIITASYPSWPINTEERKRLILSTGSADFFSEDGETGIKASQRIKGVVLHDILSRVSHTEDLGKSVTQSLADGDIDEDEAAEIKVFLKERIESAKSRGWFSEDAKEVYNEVSLIDTDGEIYRPDRVEIKADGEVLIIDYKFGEHRKSYEKQVAKYADIYRRMGYPRVTPALWYLFPDIVR